MGKDSERDQGLEDSDERIAAKEEIHMNIVIVPKDSCMQRLQLKDVSTWYHSHGQYIFVFADLSVRSYPDCHVWYVESHRFALKAIDTEYDELKAI